MSTRPLTALVVGALLVRPLAVAAAQDTAAPTRDTVQGYAPEDAVPETAPAAAPVAAPTAGTTAAALSTLGFVEIVTPRPADRSASCLNGGRPGSTPRSRATPTSSDWPCGPGDS